MKSTQFVFPASDIREGARGRRKPLLAVDIGAGEVASYNGFSRTSGPQALAARVLRAVPSPHQVENE